LFFSNPTANAIVLTFVPGILYTFAAYGQLYLKHASLGVAIVVSIFFAVLEYIVRVPIVKYSSAEAGMSNGTMQIIWVVITLLLGYASDFIYPVPKH
jgi:hypothetical protein